MEGGTMVCYGLYLFNSWLDFSQKSSSIVIWKQFLKPNTEMQLQKSSFDFILNSYVNLSSTYLGCTQPCFFLAIMQPISSSSYPKYGLKNNYDPSHAQN